MEHVDLHWFSKTFNIGGLSLETPTAVLVTADRRIQVIPDWWLILRIGHN